MTVLLYLLAIYLTAIVLLAPFAWSLCRMAALNDEEGEP